MVPDDATVPVPQSQQVVQMIWGFMASQALHVGAKLAVFDVLSHGPKTVRQIAEACASQETPLRRLLRFLTTIGVLSEDALGKFSCTNLGELLQTEHPQSLRALAIMYGEPFWWRPWGDFHETVKNGQPAFNRVYGEGFFAYLAHEPIDAAIFNAGMTSATSVDVRAILAAYDFSDLDRIVDVAGGHGALLCAILEQYPNCSGVLYDLPTVVAGASEIKESPVGSRCEFVGGDFFDSAPRDGDAYLLKRILHDWNDDEAVRILQSCRRAMAPAGRVLVMEQVVSPSNQPDPAKWMDLNMLVMLTGRERTVAEFSDLYASAGFRLTRVVPAMRLSILEGRAA